MPIDRNTYLGNPIKTEYSPAELIEFANSDPQFNWVAGIALAENFVTPTATMIAIANSPFMDSITAIAPIGMAQSIQVNEGQAVGLLPEIGSRRKRPVVGPSQGGSITISGMVCTNIPVFGALMRYNTDLGMAQGTWQESTDLLTMVGLNHDRAKSSALGVLIIERTADKGYFRTVVYENSLVQGQAESYQAGQTVVVTNISMVYEQRCPLTIT